MRSFLALIPAFALAPACVAEPGDLDELDGDVDEPVADAGKADASESRHYLITSNGDPEYPRYTLTRAGGGSLRCPDNVARTTCELDGGESDLSIASYLDIDVTTVLDELADHAMIARGRLVKVDDRVQLRVTALTRGITNVAPTGTCYRIRPLTAPSYRLERLDRTTSELPQVLFFDYVDPTPDFWGQPTPAVQVKIDAGLALAATRPVYTCGDIDRRDSGDLYWATQLFVPKT